MDIQIVLILEKRFLFANFGSQVYFPLQSCPLLLLLSLGLALLVWDHDIQFATGFRKSSVNVTGLLPLPLLCTSF